MLAVNLSMGRSLAARMAWGAAAVALALALTALAGGAALAQDADAEATTVRGAFASVRDNNKPPSSEEARISDRPALPANASPQVGPVIKRYYEDVVDRRTTAYFPVSLDNLTPIEMPDTDEAWVRIDLSEQILVAYQGKRVARAFVIASGLPGTPTVTGQFRIRMKVRSQLMEGGSPAENNDYYLPNVEWVQYFYEDYGLHGTYWHNSFGSPRSHGCVNLTNADAKWLWDFLGPKWDGHTAWQRSTEENPGSIVIVTE